MIADSIQMELGQSLTHIDQSGLTLRSQYLTIAEVGAFLRCSRSTVLRMVKRGKLPQPVHRSGAKNSPLLFSIGEIARFGYIMSNLKISGVDVINTREGGVLLDMPSQCMTSSRLAF